MNAMEIILLIAGSLIVILSFVLPDRGNTNAEGNKTLAREEIKDMVSKEMETVKGHVNDVVDEAVDYAVEKTERSLERLSNEKIMAVSEYSDTVLKEINKNHQEVMFLYDMLNEKQVNIKNTVSEVNKTVNSFQKLSPETIKLPENDSKPDETLNAKQEPKQKSKQESKQERESETDVQKHSLQEKGMNISFIQENNEQGRNYNERILEMYKQGKSKVAIAKELGLGVGEVKLVIDLYKNMV